MPEHVETTHTPAVAAARLSEMLGRRVSKRSMERWLHEKRIRHLRVAGRTYVPESALVEFVEACRVEPEAATG